MSKRRPPSQRPERMGQPEPDEPITHATLCRTVEQSEDLILAAWARRTDDRAVVVLGDLRREESRAACEDFWGKDAVALALTAPADRRWMAWLQPPGFIDTLARSSSFALREAAKELRAFTLLSWAGIVPLFVVPRHGCWATQWAKPGGKAAVVRYEPEPTPESN